ncbi:MAG: NADH-quinone oxidoreductase subunit N [Phycisphaeraceae bacterium]|nr:NADH-quinone oxidoreductase subunit N [Phycisphaeraceae bacterium]
MSNLMVDKVATLWPEMVMLAGAVACLMTGLSSQASRRRTVVWIAAATLVIAGIIAAAGTAQATSGVGLAGMAKFIKVAVAAVGLLLLMLNTSSTSQEGVALMRDTPELGGEFFAFFLCSLTGVMLTAGADDLVWLFLALELTSLPTYVMVAMGRQKLEARESAVKYFFLGAMSAALFLYGFALLYGAAGSTQLADIHQYALDNPHDGLLMFGLVLAVVGICFKIAAVPMHFYAADVYQGAASPVTAFLAFVPKSAGFLALLLMLGIVGWPLPQPIAWLIAAIAVATMTVGNVLGLVQSNVKRVLAYSSIAHSGYMLLGVLIGPPGSAPGSGNSATSAIGNGVAAVLFYLLAYGFSTIAAFAVLACLRVENDEAQTYNDLAGLMQRRPALAAVMVVAALSLLGLPPMVGFLGKIYLFGSALTQGYVVLVVIAVLNSAISAGYYLPIAASCIFSKPMRDVQTIEAPGRQAGAVLAAILAVVLGFGGGKLVSSANDAGRVVKQKHADKVSQVDQEKQFTSQ